MMGIGLLVTTIKDLYSKGIAVKGGPSSLAM